MTIISYPSCRVVEIPVDVWLHILSFLEFRDLCHLSQLNNFFHDLCQDESTWRRLVLRNGWKRDPHTSSWKECFKYFWQPRRCVRCNELYRECSNGWQACVHHPGERALWEDYNSGPSGVYWTCCEVLHEQICPPA